MSPDLLHTCKTIALSLSSMKRPLSFNASMMAFLAWYRFMPCEAHEALVNGYVPRPVAWSLRRKVRSSR